MKAELGHNTYSWKNNGISSFLVEFVSNLLEMDWENNNVNIQMAMKFKLVTVSQ